MTDARRRLSELADAGGIVMQSNATNGTNATHNPCTRYVRRIYSLATQKLLRGIVSAQLEARGELGSFSGCADVRHLCAVDKLPMVRSLRVRRIRLVELESRRVRVDLDIFGDS